MKNATYLSVTLFYVRFVFQRDPTKLSPFQISNTNPHNPNLQLPSDWQSFHWTAPRNIQPFSDNLTSRFHCKFTQQTSEFLERKFVRLSQVTAYGQRLIGKGRMCDTDSY